MVVFPNAKINIGLNIINKREDGFHNIESVFYPIGLCDILEVVVDEISEKGNVEFENTGILAGNNSENLVVKAYQLLHNDFSLPAVKTHLHKTIPIGAGLGGGSADAAFMIKLLNQLFQLGLYENELEKYASVLGSDCTFFIKNKPTFVEGKGEILTPLGLDISEYKMILVYPQVHISTPQAYSGITPRKPESSLKNKIQTNIKTWRENVQNDFEGSIFPSHPEIENIKNKLYKMGAVYASMSGSGSSVYGIFETLPDEGFRNTFRNCYIWENKKN